MKEQIIKIFILVVVIFGAIFAAWQLKNRNIVIDAPLNYRTVVHITAEDIHYHISVLASDSLEGRKAGTVGEIKAARYIKRKFKELGLKYFPGGYDQLFSYQGRREFQDCSLTFGSFTGIFEDDFRPGIVADSMNASGEVTFFCNMYNYKGIDVKNQWIMMFEGDRFNPNTQHAEDLFAICRNAQKNGAVGVLSINIDSVSNGTLVPRSYLLGSTGIPLIRISRKTADSLFKYIGMTTFEVLNKTQDTTNHWYTRIPVKVGGAICMKQDSVHSRNVVAYLEGNDPELKDEYIIVGAHYDHMGVRSSRMYRGADDNASGVAGLLELAEKLVSENRLKRTVLFVAFGAEEQGLLGSNYFCEHMPINYKKITLMVNMDMIGRLDLTEQVCVNTGFPDPALEELIADLGKSHPGVNPVFPPNQPRNTDYVPFYDRLVSVASFTTGIHKQYHTVDDTLDTIDCYGEKLLLELIADLIVEKAGIVPRK